MKESLMNTEHGVSAAYANRIRMVCVCCVFLMQKVFFFRERDSACSKATMTDSRRHEGLGDGVGIPPTKETILS